MPPKRKPDAKKPTKPAKSAPIGPILPRDETSETVKRLPPTASLSPEDKVRKLMVLTGAGNLGEQVISSIMDAMVAQGAIPAEFAEKFKERVDSHELIEKVIPVYLEHCDNEMIEAAIIFYESAPGRRFAKAQMPITQASMIIGQQWGLELAQRAIQAMEEDEKGTG